MKMRHIIAKTGRAVLGDRRYNRLRLRLDSDIQFSFLAKAHGIVHVGASQGQERLIYDAFALRVIWIEPIPDVFSCLRENVKPYPHQKALNYLISDQEGLTHQLHVSNNAGLSSSILNLAKHREMWPEVEFIDSLTLTAHTLPCVFAMEHLDISNYDVLVLDTQGSEYNILKGAASLLPHFRFIKTEAPDFEAYQDCGHVKEIGEFLASHGFRERTRIVQKEMAGVGTYFDVIYERAGRRLG